MANIYDMKDTWNDGSTTFTAIKMDVTDAASDAGSLLLDLKVGGVTKASIDKNGNLTATLTAIDDVPIGATTPSTGAFTTLTASSIDYPTSDGTSGQVITTDGSGTLSFTTIASDKIEEGNSSVEVVDAGTGKIEFTVDAVEIADFTASAVVFNESGADVDFRVESDTDANAFFLDGATGDVSIGQNLKFNSGYGSVATAYGCRAWVNFNGTGTVAIREDGNVSSITDIGTGRYDVNFTTAMPDANYSFSISTYNGGEIGALYAAPATGSVGVQTFSRDDIFTLADPTDVAVAIFR